MTAQQLAKALGITSTKGIYYVPANDFNMTHNQQLVGKVYRDIRYIPDHVPVGNLEIALMVLFHSLEARRFDQTVGDVDSKSLELNHKARTSLLWDMSKLTGFSLHFTNVMLHFWQTTETSYTKDNPAYKGFIESTLNNFDHV